VFEREEEVVERVVRHLRQPVRVDPALDGRVMAKIASLPAGGRSPAAAAWHWLVTPRRVPVSPLTGVALAAGLATLLLARPWDVGAADGPKAGDRFQFVLLAPSANSVSLVGDFNDWDSARTPMRAAPQGVWTVVLPLAPGRYRYAFLLNGSQWLADPTAPRAADDEFGGPNSVVTVGGS
jgi:predicted carbohydrate-binding protein with CBM48